MKTLKIQELSKNFGTTEVLRKINLEIDEGNFLVLLGPSGCGKSTLSVSYTHLRAHET